MPDSLENVTEPDGDKEVVLTGFTVDDVELLVAILSHAPGGYGHLLDIMRGNYARLKPWNEDDEL